MNVIVSDWIEIGNLEDIPKQGSRVIKTDIGCIAIFRTSEDEVFAIDDKCPHKQGPLSQGIVHGKSVTCPLHNWVISLDSGLVHGPDEGSVRTVPTRIENGKVLLDRMVLGAFAA